MNPIYAPYSDTDTGDDTGNNTDDTDDTDNTDDIVDQREIDPRYAIIRAAGPNLDSSDKIKYMENSPGSEYTSNVVDYSKLAYINPPTMTVTSLFCMKSLNRDKGVYPSPYNFQVKLPRVYKNVTRFQIVQISFPFNTQDVRSATSFASTFSTIVGTEEFSPLCISSCLNIFTNSGTKSNAITVLEQGRLVNGSQMITKLDIPEGTLTNPQIANQLTIESNNTPPFNLISYEDFKNIFKLTKDITILFNEPGDNYHSKLLVSKYQNPDKNIIMNTYYSQYDIDRHPVITDIIAYNAYYYPVLKELVNTECGPYFINTDKDRLIYNVLHTFLGLDSMIYYELCLQNRAILDEFRKNFTFQHRNINKYNWSYDSGLKRFNCTHDTLHTSIKNDINHSLTQYTIQELDDNSLTVNTFNEMKIINAANNIILNDLQTNLHDVFTTYFLEKDVTYNGDVYSSSNKIRTFSDLHNDPLFTNIFDYTRTFGCKHTYPGKKLTFSNFLDYHSTLSSYTSIVQSTTNSFSTIHGNIYNKHHTYISSKYTNVFSDDMIKNKSYVTAQSLPAAFTSNLLTVPGMAYNICEICPAVEPTFSTCVTKCYNIVNDALKVYHGCLPFNTVINTLNYRLGLNNENTLNFNTINTFLNKVGDYHYDLFLQVNPEQSFNNMDIAMPENYNITNETTGQSKIMYAKILTGGIGANEMSQSCIQNPIVFQNPLGKLDKLICKIYLDDEELTPMWLFSPFFEKRDEWNATFQIDEEVGFADKNAGWGTNPTIPASSASSQYMGVAPK